MNVEYQKNADQAKLAGYKAELKKLALQACLTSIIALVGAGQLLLNRYPELLPYSPTYGLKTLFTRTKMAGYSGYQAALILIHKQSA